ncbi:MAG TPA: hypothetical protein VFJ06_07275 [Halococcus sp.]|nr:hypothetical protein [Halococcus sp.]
MSEQVRGFWSFFWVYAETHVGVYRATTAVAAMFGVLMYFDPWFALPAVATYFLPPMYLYLTRDEEEKSPVQQLDTHDNDTDFDGRDSDSDGADTDFDGRDADADGRDADADGADADADGADIDIDN